MGKAPVTFLEDQSGVTGIEYGVIALGIMLVIVSAVGIMGQHLKLSLFHIAAALIAGGPPTIH